MVQSVDAFGAKLKRQAFSYRGVLDDGKIPVIGAVTADSRKARTQGLQIRTELGSRVALKSGVDVEPAVHRALAVGNRNVGQISCKDGVAEAQRRTALSLIDSRDLPAAGHLGSESSPGIPQAPAFAEGQLIHGGDCQAVGAILVGNHFLRQRIAGI